MAKAIVSLNWDTNKLCGSCNRKLDRWINRKISYGDDAQIKGFRMFYINYNNNPFAKLKKVIRNNILTECRNGRCRASIHATCGYKISGTRMNIKSKKIFDE